MKGLFLFCIFISFSVFAEGRTVRVSDTSECTSTIERNEIGIFTQKSKLKACAKESAIEALYYKCETQKAGQLVSKTKAADVGCESRIVWGGRLMICSAKVTGECLID